jgi:hypothetical protein
MWKEAGLLKFAWRLILINQLLGKYVPRTTGIILNTRGFVLFVGFMAAMDA